MKDFLIKELERFSGIKAHTIRRWEERYQVFAPVRNGGNIRTYCIADVQRLLAITMLLKKYRISSVSRLTLEELEQKLSLISNEEEKQKRAVSHLICYMYADIEKFEDVLDSCISFWGIEITIEKIILPFIEKAGLLSYKDKNYETHFVVTALRKKIIFGIEKNTTGAMREGSALLFLPQGEHYDLILLYLAFLLKRNGIRVFYLGTDISTKNLVRIAGDKKLDYLFTYISYKQSHKLAQFASFLDGVPGKMLTAITCEDDEPIKELNNVVFVHYKMLPSMIASLRTEARTTIQTT